MQTKVFPAAIPKDGAILRLKVQREPVVRKTIVHKHVFEKAVSDKKKSENLPPKAISRGALAKRRWRIDPKK